MSAQEFCFGFAFALFGLACTAGTSQEDTSSKCTKRIPNESCVRFTYNEASNVIMTVTGNASHTRGSEFCQRKQLCPGYRPMGLSRNSAH